MKFSTFLFCFISSIQTVWAQNHYQYSIDLKNIVNDQVSVSLKTPQINEQSVTYSFPKAIPGSYAIKDFGRFIVDFTPLDKQGKKLKAQKVNDNQYLISNAKDLAQITYKVNDTWDKAHKNFIFQPGGSNISEGKNFVINNHAFYGFFEEYKGLPIEITITKPPGFYGATHLGIQRMTDGQDVLKARNYIELADNPVIYARPDTSSFYSGKTKIDVFVYSANNRVKSATVAEILKPMTSAMEKFFDGLPVNSYQFLFYFDDPEKILSRLTGGGGYGALEHNYSSLYYLPETLFANELKSLVLEVSTHEFLHILTPLNLHSTEIANFDFTSPKMSRHLWLYEGVTEYFAQLALLQNKIIDQKKFFETMQSKIGQADEFGNFSMTEMSSNVMTDTWKDKYNSVYSRGAVLALMLDLEIRERTAGVKDLKSVIQALAKKYGPAKPFNDDDLISECVKESHPDVEKFFATYIQGAAKLPLKEYFGKLGYQCLPYKIIEGYYAGKFEKKIDPATQTISFKNVEKNLLGIKEGDVVIKIQDYEITPGNIEELWEKYFNFNINAPEVYVTVKRDGVEKNLSASLYKARMTVENYLEVVSRPTEKQQAMLEGFVK